MENREKYRTRLLPHWDFGDVVQTITYRLGDSIPPTVYQQFWDLTDLLPPESQNRQKRQLIENWIDAHRFGCCALSNPIAAEIVIESWRFFDSKRYDLLHWAVMPNHVHLMIRQYKGFSLGDVVGGWKSYTSKEISKKLNVPNPLWHRGYWDRQIRDAEHYARSRDYILNNPAKAGLLNWRFVSSKYK